ncbi:MAG: 4Fe-4S binding protein [Acidobacteriota bacterium]|nr:MAG: 4Fe-4S dicluster domain-containing protein [Acidobacteriota bacterium]
MPETAKKKKPPARITIRDDRCKGCEFCVMFCPQDVLEMQGVLPVVKDADACTRCMICESVCPDFAITVE